MEIDIPVQSAKRGARPGPAYKGAVFKVYRGLCPETAKVGDGMTAVLE